MIQTSIKQFDPVAFHKAWIKTLPPLEAAKFLAKQEQEDFAKSLTKALEFELNKLRHYFYAVAISKYRNPTIEIYVRHTDEKITVVLEFVNNFTELSILQTHSDGNQHQNIIFLGDPVEFDPKKILDDLYITYGPKGGTKLLNLLEDVLKRKDK